MSTQSRVSYMESVPLSYIEAAPAQSIALSARTATPLAAPAQSIALSAPAQSAVYVAAAATGPVEAAPAISNIVEQIPTPPAEDRWADYSPEEVDLGAPELPAPDYRCYQPPTVPPGQTRYLKVEQPTSLKNLEQNFNDVRTAIRENNTHIQRNKTNITNINRNHNHLLRIVTNENNFNHFLTNNVVRVADIHRQRIENLKGETRNFKDFKATQKVEATGCRRDGLIQLAAAPLQQAAVVVQQEAPALTAKSAASAASAAPSQNLALAQAQAQLAAQLEAQSAQAAAQAVVMGARTQSRRSQRSQ